MIESRILVSRAPIDTYKVTSDNTIFNLTQSVAVSNTTESALATGRMQKPTKLVTLSLDSAIESGKTIIGQLGEGAE